MRRQAAIAAVTLVATCLICSPARSQFGRGEEKVQRQLVPAPRELKLHLDRARKALEQSKYDETCDHLNEILKSDAEDYFLEAKDDASSLKVEAARFALQLEGKAREAYELRMGSEANALLEEALRTMDVAQLDYIRHRFVGTDAGVKAAIVAARVMRDRGAPISAAIRLQPIVEHGTFVRRFEPELSLLLASCWLEGHERQMARDTLLHLHKTADPKLVRLGDEDVAWFQSDEQVDEWMDRWLPASRFDIQLAEIATPPKFQLAWRIRHGEHEDEANLIKALSDKYRTEGLPAASVLSPITDDGWVVARSTRRVFGMAPDGGKRMWSYPSRLGDDLDDDLLVVGKDNRRTLSWMGQNIHRRLWTDRLYGSMSSDGKRVYLLDRLAMPQVKTRYSSMQNVNLPRPLRFPLPDPNQNRLVALDLNREGAISWIAGGEETSDSKLESVFFLSPALPYRDQVYVLVEMQQQIKLVSLDCATGKVQWEQTLLALNNNPVGSDVARRLEGARLMLNNEMLVCWTAADYLFGIDLPARKLAWQIKPAAAKSKEKTQPQIEIFPEPEYSTYYRNQFDEWKKFQEQATPRDRWIDPALLCDGRHCIITPRTENTVTCLDLYTGKVLWTKPRGDFVYAACIYDQSVFLVGRYRLGMLRLADGSPAWSAAPLVAMPSVGAPAGRGTQLYQFYVFPTTEEELITVDMKTGQTSRQVSQHALGNMSRRGELLVSQSPLETVAFHLVQEPEAQADANQEQAQDDEAPPKPEGNVAVVEPRIQQLVDQLGSPKFQLREQAEQELASMGGAVETALSAAVSSTDTEIRIRARRLLETISRSARNERLAAFRKNEADADKRLPGWNDFKANYGDSEDSRNLFASMYEQEWKLIDLSSNRPDRLAQRMNTRCQELQTAMSQFRYQLSMPTTATLLHLCAHKNVRDNTTVINHVSNFCFQNSFRQGMQNDKQGKLLKQMIAEMLKVAKDSENYQLVNLGMQYDLKECYPIARKIVASQQAGYAKAYSMMAVARYGNDKDAELFDKALKDNYQCSSYSINGKRYMTQVRDVALVCLIELAGKDPKKFGFDRLQKSNNVVSMHTIGFEDDKTRSKSFDKWTQFKEGKFDPDAATEDEEGEGDEKDKKEKDKKAPAAEPNPFDNPPVLEIGNPFG